MYSFPPGFITVMGRLDVDFYFEVKQFFHQYREAQEVTKADSLLDQVIELRDKALSILAKAERAGELRTALQGVREAKGCLELLARLQGELQERTTVNVLVNPQWITLRTVILKALDGYPDARHTVARALQEVEGNAVSQ
jgi:hypothetical protein